MADIVIKNPEGALDNCGRISSFVAQLDNQISTLSSTLQQISTHWASNGIDKESYMVELKKHISNLQIIRNAVNKFVNSISNYVTNNKQVSNLKIGESFSGYNGTTGYRTASNAVNDTNSVNLNTKVVNEDSTINGFAVVDKNGAVTNITNADGMTATQFAQDNGVTLDQVAVNVGKNGQSQAWVQASDFN